MPCARERAVSSSCLRNRYKSDRTQSQLDSTVMTICIKAHKYVFPKGYSVVHEYSFQSPPNNTCLYIYTPRQEMWLTRDLLFQLHSLEHCVFRDQYSLEVVVNNFSNLVNFCFQYSTETGYKISVFTVQWELQMHILCYVT